MRNYRFIREIDETLAEVKEKLEEPQIIEGNPLDKAWFIDGSSAISERQGSFVSAFSVASLGVFSKRYVEGLPGNEHLLLHVVLPKLYGETRTMNLMSSLELLEGLRAAKEDIDILVFDGSYLALLLAGYGSLHERIAQLERTSHGEVSMFREILESIDIEQYIEESIEAFLSEVEKEKSFQSYYRSAFKILTAIYDFTEQLYGELSSKTIVKKYLDNQFVIDFSVLYVETTLYLYILGRLLERIREKDIISLWVAKETASRFLSTQLDVKSWLTDVVLLESAWRTRERVYLVLRESDRSRALHPVNPPNSLVAAKEAINLAYKWNRFGVVYFKVSRQGPVFQATYPADLVPEERIEDALQTLATLSDLRNGYPKPLAMAHHKALIPTPAVETLAYKLWLSATGALRGILAPLGREKAL